MRFAVKSLMIVAAVAGGAVAQVATPPINADDDDSQKIRRSMQEAERAFVAREAGPLESIYIEGYVGIRGKPIYNTREQLAAMVRHDAAALKAGKKLDFETISYDSEPPTITLFGDSAIVNVVKKDLWRYREDRCLSQYQTTELWIKLAGEWKVAASHASTIQCEPMPWQPPHPAVAAVRPRLKPIKYLSTTVETDLRELLSELTEAGLIGETATDAFVPNYVATGSDSVISNDRTALLATLKIPTSRDNERYRDDEVFLTFGNAAIYVFRVRSFPKGNETAPTPPVVHSVIFVRSGGDWKIAASHASTMSD